MRRSRRDVAGLYATNCQRSRSPAGDLHQAAPQSASPTISLHRPATVVQGLVTQPIECQDRRRRPVVLVLTVLTGRKCLQRACSSPGSISTSGTCPGACTSPTKSSAWLLCTPAPLTTLHSTCRGTSTPFSSKSALPPTSCVYTCMVSLCAVSLPATTLSLSVDLLSRHLGSFIRGSAGMPRCSSALHRLCARSRLTPHCPARRCT